MGPLAQRSPSLLDSQRRLLVDPLWIGCASELQRSRHKRSVSLPDARTMPAGATSKDERLGLIGIDCEMLTRLPSYRMGPEPQHHSRAGQGASWRQANATHSCGTSRVGSRRPNSEARITADVERVGGDSRPKDGALDPIPDGGQHAQKRPGPGTATARPRTARAAGRTWRISPLCRRIGSEHRCGLHRFGEHCVHGRRYARAAGSDRAPPVVCADPSVVAVGGPRVCKHEMSGASCYPPNP